MVVVDFIRRAVEFMSDFYTNSPFCSVRLTELGRCPLGAAGLGGAFSNCKSACLLPMLTAFLELPRIPGNRQVLKALRKEFWKGFYDCLSKPYSPGFSESEGGNIRPQLDGHVKPNGSDHRDATADGGADGNWADLGRNRSGLVFA